MKEHFEVIESIKTDCLDFERFEIPKGATHIFVSSHEVCDGPYWGEYNNIFVTLEFGKFVKDE